MQNPENKPAPRASTPALAAAVAAAALALTLKAGVVSAATWAGANINTTNTSTNIDLPANWTGVTDSSGIPGPTDSALFNWTLSGSTNIVNVASTATFNPGSIELNAGTSSTSYLAVDKSLSLTSLKVTGSGTSGGNYQSRIRFGLNNAVTIGLSGSTPFTGLITWGGINAGTGTNKVTFNLSNASISIPTLVTTATGQSATTTTSSAINGGLALMTAAQLANAPEMRFTNVGGAVNLATPGYRAEGSLSLGNVGLFVRSDQTWTADSAAYVRMIYRGGDSTAQPVVVGSIDGGRLDNLSAVNLVLVGGQTGTTGTTAANGMRLGGGTYGSLRFSGGSTTLRDNYMVMTGNVQFVGYNVTPGVYDAVPANQVNATPDSTYGLHLAFGTGTSVSHKYLVTNGNALTVDKGMLMDDQSNARTDTVGLVSMLDASGSTVSIGGPVVVTSLNHSPAGRTIAANRNLTRAMGLRGDATTTISFGDSYSNRMASLSGTGLQASTVNMIGGAATTRTFEVGDAASLVTLASTANFNIGKLNIGTATTAGKVQLVNDYLNDNPVVVGDDPAVKKAGEKLIVGDLDIAASSRLDVNGLPVLLGSAATLSIAATGTLDLRTGLTLSAGSLVNSFVGLGDQTLIWNLSASRVIDSSNPTLGFTAVTSGGNTLWQAQAVPEPGTAALAVAAIAGAALSRRRRI